MPEKGLAGADSLFSAIDLSFMDDRVRPKECARLLTALADPLRLKIVQCLRMGTRNVTELATLLGVEPGIVSNHLRVLRNAGLVSHDKQRTFVVYSLSTDFFRAKAPETGPMRSTLAPAEWN
jgi:ArsR family transcriptional regulator